MPNQRNPIQGLRFDQLTIKFPDQEPLLNRCDFDFPMREVLWVKSSEGAGKSSLLQILAGLENPNGGRFWINQVDVTEMSFEEFLPYRLNIGYSFDYGGLISNRSLYDNLMLPLVYHHLVSPTNAKQRVLELLKKFDISKMAQERPAHVPGRVRKLTCLLRAIVTEPELLLLDDPSVGLGFDTVQTFVEHLDELRQRGTCKHIIISSYDEKFLGLLPHRVLHLEGQSLYLENADITKKVVHL
jgi:phospholipid/cholesterol/gamma-HCH transport system ATP-binding protein